MWPNPQFPANLVTFTEEILNGKLHFLCSVICTKASFNKAAGVSGIVFFLRTFRIFLQLFNRTPPGDYFKKFEYQEFVIVVSWASTVLQINFSEDIASWQCKIISGYFLMAVFSNLIKNLLWSTLFSVCANICLQSLWRLTVNQKRV